MSSSTSTNLNGMNSAFTFHVPRVSLSARHRYDPIPQERRTTPTFAYNSEGATSFLPVSSDAAGNPITSGGDGPLLSSGTSYGVSQASADVATYDNDAVQFHVPKDTRSTVAELYDLPESPTSTQPVNEKFLECVLGVLESIKSSSPQDDAPSLPVDDFIPQETSNEDIPDKENIDTEPSSVTRSKGKEILGSPLTNALPDTINWNALLNLDDDPVTKLFVDYIIENRKSFTFEGVSAFLDICAQDGLTIDEVTRSDIFKMIGHSPPVDPSPPYAQDSSFHGEEAYSSMCENSGNASQTHRMPDIVTQGAGASTYPSVVGAYPDNQPAWPSSFQSLNHHSQELCNTYGAYGAPTSYDPRYVAAPNSMGTPYQNGAVSSYHEPTAYGWNNFTGYSHLAGPSVGQSQPTWNVYVPPTPSLASSSSSSSSGSRASSILPTPIEGNFEFNVGQKRTFSDAGLDESSQFEINGGFSQHSMNITPIDDNASQVTWHVNSFQYEGQPAAQSVQARPAKKRKSPKQGGQAPPTGTQKTRKRTKVRDLLSHQVYDPILWIARDMPACGSEIFCPLLDCQTYIRLDENEDKHITIFRHVLKHSELTTIQCPCGRHFCRPDSLKRHAKKSKHSECMYWLDFIRWQEGQFRRKVKKVCKLYKEGKENQALALKEEIIVFRLACQRHNRRLAGKLQVVKGDSLALSDWKLLSADFEEDGASVVFGREISRCAMLYTM